MPASTPTTPPRRPGTRPGWRPVVAAAVALALAGVVHALVPALQGAGTGATTPALDPPTRDRPDVEVSIRVDPTLAPRVAAVDGLEPGDPDRPTGHLVDGDGHGIDLVRGEVVVGDATPAELAAFLARWDAVVVEGSAEAGDVLVRIDPDRVAVDPVETAAALRAIDPELWGEVRVDDPATLAVVAVAARETAGGLDVIPNVLVTHDGPGGHDGIVRGETTEGVHPNLVDADSDHETRERARQAFRWPELRAGGELDYAVAPAWQMLHHHERLDRSVRVMVVDGGFAHNPDFPDASRLTLRHADWGDENRGDCGNPCPWHGTDVAVAMFGQVDNRYGGAGPAGPVVEHAVLVAGYRDFWKMMRRAERRADDHRPHVVNMSFSMHVSSFKAAQERAVDRRLRRMTERGALVVASAGNDGRNIDQEICVAGSCSRARVALPCASRYALCVGGLRSTTAHPHSGSNWGSRDHRGTVELYGPFCTVGIADPPNAFSTDATRMTCGTSFASPFVAGVAALVKAADPALGPEEIRDVVVGSAHPGPPPHPLSPYGHVRVVDAVSAVSAAFGVPGRTVPRLDVRAPTANGERTRLEWVDLDATATEFTGRPLPVRWESHLDGVLVEAATGPETVPPLSVGDHVLTATTVDQFGRTSSVQRTLTVRHTPPIVRVVGPSPATVVYEGQPLDLHGFTLAPDTVGPLRDWDVTWEVERDGDLVHAATGHDTTVPAGVLVPGVHVLRFTGDDGGHTESDSVLLEVRAIPEGESVPTATIVAPGPGLRLGVTATQDAPVRLEGRGDDEQDGELSGTRMRWVARSQHGTEVLLCSGSELGAPGGGPGPAGGTDGPALAPVAGGAGPDGLAAIVDCAVVDARLGVDLGAGAPAPTPETRWELRLEVVDSAGLVGTAAVVVVTVLAVG